MIIKTDDLKSVSQTILNAVDSNELSAITETLEIIVKNKILNMNVTNREYYTKVILNVDTEEEFYATVNANVFLKLISQITTDSIEFTIDDSVLIIKGNGTYKLPMIYDNDKLLKLPEIIINNVTSEFDIDSSVLTSIYNFNSKQLNTGLISKPVQKMYYIDEKGAITFTSGACVNSFSLEKPIKMLLNSRIVKLFKLFKDSTVHFTIGYDAVTNEIIQTKVKFSSSNIEVTAILSCDDAMINSVPVTAIRGRANADYPYSVNFNKNAVIEAINRLSLFTSKSFNAVGKFVFGSSCVTISDVDSNNKEIIEYNNEVTNIESEYTSMLDLNDLKSILDSCSEQYINVKFGDSQAVLVSRTNVVNVIPELSE